MPFEHEHFMQEVMNDPLVHDVWRRKYRAEGEETVAQTRERVVRGIFAEDRDREAFLDTLDLVQRGVLIPAGRVNAGAGLAHRVTLMNCFVNETIQDSMIGIQRGITRAAFTMQQSGGIGTDWSTVRPRGALVRRTGSVSSGVVPFMRQMDSMCSSVVAGGGRRGAMMGTLRDDHPDLWHPDQWRVTRDHAGAERLNSPSFITAKTERGQLTQFNLSILVSDAFMHAVEDDRMWDLGFHVPRADGKHAGVLMRPMTHDVWDEENDTVIGVDRDLEYAPKRTLAIARGTLAPWYVYRRVRAREMWEDITRCTYRYSEPGVVYIDQINKRNNLHYCEDVRCTNPCGEQPLPPHGVCCLGSVNLAFLVQHPFTSDAFVDMHTYRRAVRLGVRMLDNVLDVSRYPIEEQRIESMSKRRIGLGITGFSDMLTQLSIRYDSDHAMRMAETIGLVLKNTSYQASADLAIERGPFPLFNAREFLASPNCVGLPSELNQQIGDTGIRNGVLNTIAPNGTISVYSGNISSAHEPVFSYAPVTRKIRGDDEVLTEYESVNYAQRLWCAMHEDTPLPDYFVGAMDVTIGAHLKVHAAFQRFVDASISKTINVQSDMPYEDFKRVYVDAYKMGAKGCTTYRENPESGRGSVLSVTSTTPPIVEPLGEHAAEVIEHVTPAGGLLLRERPDVAGGMTYRVRWPITGKNWYVTITSTDGTPLEMFVTGDPATQEWTTALSRTVTAVLRRGGDVRFLVEQLSEVHSANGGAIVTAQKQYRPSIVAAIGGVLDMEFRRLGMYGGADAAVTTNIDDCPACHVKSLIRENGCVRCLSCDYTHCG